MSDPLRPHANSSLEHEDMSVFLPNLLECSSAAAAVATGGGTSAVLDYRGSGSSLNFSDLGNTLRQRLPTFDSSYLTCGKAFTLVAPATSRDKRQYILHFPRDTPRDANNARSDSLFCILRPELIAALFRAQEIEKDAEESVTIPDSRGQRIVVDEEVVTKAKHRLLNDVVPSFVVDFDCRNGSTLTEKLHKYGINVRYIGEVAKRAADPDLQKLCSNEIIVRSAKHILKAVLRNTENHDDPLVTMKNDRFQRRATI